MSKHMPPIPADNRSTKGPGDDHKSPKDNEHLKRAEPQNTAEQGDTANIKQNTTNKGFFRGRR